jgi:titin
MEDRTLLATIVVTSATDRTFAADNVLTLRDAINLTNGALIVNDLSAAQQALVTGTPSQSGVTDTIDFNIPGSGVQIIEPLSELPAVTHPVIIDGYSQPGSKPNDLAAGDDAVLSIELDGSNAGGARGLWISGGGSKVMGLVINRFESYGIHLTGAGANVIEGNFLGTDPTGEIPLGNSLGVAVQSDGNRIGTDGNGTSDIPEGQNDYAERNLVSANLTGGIGVGGSYNVVSGNLVGADALGIHPLGNAVAGVSVSGYHNRIGVDGHHAAPSAERNIISGNGTVGVGLQGFGENVVAGNFVGTDVTGTQPLGNAYFGVAIVESDGNLIGTDGDGIGDATERNIISANHGDGMNSGGSNNNVVAGNFIGTDVTGTQPLGNYRAGVNLNQGSNSNTIGMSNVLNPDETVKVLRGNIISSNLGGIDLGSGAPPGQGNLIFGNWIGVGSDGRPLGNGFPVYAGGPSGGVGISIEGDSSDQIGGSPGLANIIANTFSGPGVMIEGSSTGDSVRANMIYNNRGPIGGLAIDLGRDGVTPNNSHVGQTGPNNWQNFPVLSTAVADSATRVIGTLNSTPNTTFTIDFYANDPDKGNAGAYGPGQYYLGSATVTTDGSGNASFNVSGLAATVPGEWISATATDPGGNTSEFALDVQAIRPASLSGVVFADFNNDGHVDFGEQGIPGVPISLTGADAAGDPVSLSQTTDGAGTYVFVDLPPGTYTITETQQTAG